MPAFRNGLSSMAPAILIAGACSPSATAEAQPASVAAPGTPAATTVAPLTVSPPKAADATVVVPNEDSAKGHWGSIWPESAFRGGISGHVVLSCDIDRYGLAERCKVASETPPDQGFGPAALELRPTFKLTPAMGPDGPVDAVMSIAVDFNAPHPQIDFGGAKGGGPAAASSGPMSVGAGADAPDLSGPRLPNRRVSMLDDPVWASTVGYRDVVRAYPARAGGVEGYVVAHCEVNRDGTVSDCHVIKEDPEDRGFGKAALSLAARFRVVPNWSRPPGHADLWVDIPIRFPAPGAAETRIVSRPYWVAGFDPRQALKVFPKEAADKGVSTGLGVAQCRVARDGSLTGCAPSKADPEGLGFAEAAVLLASTMRMNPWLRDGEPADGAVVRVAVRLNLKSEQ